MKYEDMGIGMQMTRFVDGEIVSMHDRKLQARMEMVGNQDRVKLEKALAQYEADGNEELADAVKRILALMI